MYKYNIGSYTPNGRMTLTYFADSREEALAQAWSDDVTVVDCNYYEHDR